jgi:hypothetical protein
MGVKLGLDAVIKFKTGGQDGGGGWTEMPTVKDVTLNLEGSEADATKRGGGGWRATLLAIQDASVEFEMVWDVDDPAFAAIRDSYLNREKIGLQVLDADDGEGLQADFQIMSFTRNEPLEEVITVSVTAKPTDSATPPSWIEPEGGTLAQPEPD